MIFSQKPKGVQEVRFIRSAIFIIAVLVFPTLSAFAQENEPQVVDEVVAQVNDGVVTLSQVKREMKNAIDALVEQRKITPEEAKAEIERSKGELIANIINEELIMQKGKELDLEAEVTSQINAQLLSMMKEYGLKNLEALYAEMRKAGVNPDDVRESYRRNITKRLVLENEVDRKIYSGWGSAEIRKYYDENKEKLVKPETVTISEIFLNFAGRDKDALKAKAYEIVSKIRKGGDFVQTAIENSDRPDVKNDKGRVGNFTEEDIKKASPLFVEPIKKTKVGDITDPIFLEEGIEIFKVDDRKSPSNEFDESTVRSAMTYEKLPEERKKYLGTLKKEGYVKVSENYRAMVAPFLAADESKNTAEVKKEEPKKTDTKKKNK